MYRLDLVNSIQKITCFILFLKTLKSFRPTPPQISVSPGFPEIDLRSTVRQAFYTRHSLLYTWRRWPIL